MKRNFAAGVTVLALAILAGCGSNDDSAQAKSVPATTSTTTGSASASASEVPVLPSEETASTKIETGTSGGYADLGERQARFDKFYPTFSKGVAGFIHSRHLGGASYFWANKDNPVPACSSTDREDEDSLYDNVSEALVLVCTYDKRHGAVQQFAAETSKPDETLLPVSIMLDGTVIMPTADGYDVSYEGSTLPDDPTLAELKQHDDAALELLKDAVHSYFGERYIAEWGLA